MIHPQPAVQSVSLIRFVGETPETHPDLVVREEPLEIRLGHGPENAREQHSISVTLRTPGHDLDLAIGFLFSEGVIRKRSDVDSVNYCLNVDTPEAEGNVVKVELSPNVSFDFARLERHFYTTSSCGVCGKTSLEAVRTACDNDYSLPDLALSAAFIQQLDVTLRNQQSVFNHTGGLHAAALFSSTGELIALREDVGRHNAVDKLIGGMFMKGAMPLSNYLLWVSGRAGFELVQKAVMAGIPAMVAVGAPSSLSVNLAIQHNLTLIGFARQDRFNVYAGVERIR